MRYLTKTLRREPSHFLTTNVEQLAPVNLALTGLSQTT